MFQKKVSKKDYKLTIGELIAILKDIDEQAANKINKQS